MRLRTRVTKLLGMSAHEMAGRLQAGAIDCFERAQRPGLALEPERLVHSLPKAVANSPDWRAALLAQRRRERPRFFASVEQRESIRPLLRHEYAETWQGTCREADRARSHSVALFGQTFDFGPSIDWKRDPVSGRAWADGWHATIPLAGSESAGDVKYVWELSRHQFLIDLAKRHWVLEDPSDAAEVFTSVRHWIETNPYGHGVNWSNPLEPAYRSLSWLWAYYLCLDAPALDADTHALWLASFHDHGRFLHGHLELYASPFNHLVSEAAVLYVLGLMFPEFREAAAWRRRGRQVLEERLSAQFYADGGTVEQATCYHHATLGFYLVAALLGRANGDEFPPRVWASIERAIEFSMHLVQPDGTVPAIGDNDDANPVRSRRESNWNYRVFQSIGAVLFDRGDFKYVAREFDVDALWLLGPAARDAFARLEQTPPDGTSKALAESGYFVLRSDWSDEADYACVDCGEQAGGLRQDGIPSSAHGHADCLSLTLFLRGRPVLVDAGFYTYNGAQPWERYFRETAAHNTARIDGRDQATHLEQMAWSDVPAARLEQWGTARGQAWVTGSHDGYAKGPGGVVHRRTVWLRPGGYVLIYDEFCADGDGAHDVEINFQLSPEVNAEVRGQSLVGGDGVGFCWFGLPGVEAALRQGGQAPDTGWIASGLGVRVPAPRLTLSSRLTARHEGMLTVVADLSAVRVSPSSSNPSPDGRIMPFEVTVTTAHHVDHIVVGRGTPGGVGGFETDAPIAVWRMANGAVTEATRVGGSYQRCQRSAVA